MNSPKNADLRCDSFARPTNKFTYRHLQIYNPLHPTSQKTYASRAVSDGSSASAVATLLRRSDSAHSQAFQRQPKREPRHRRPAKRGAPTPPWGAAVAGAQRTQRLLVRGVS